MNHTIGHDSFAVGVDIFTLDADPAKVLQSDFGISFKTGCASMTTYATSNRLRAFAHAIVVACDQFDISKQEVTE